MTDSLETIKNWWSPEIKYDWQKEHQETSNLAEIQKGIPHLHPMTIPDYQENIGIATKNWDYQRNKQRLARNQDYQKKSGISKTKIETAKFSPTTLAENMKVTIQRNDWSKDRYSRRTTRTYNPMQCIFMFCIVLQSCVYLYTQFQIPPAW